MEVTKPLRLKHIKSRSRGFIGIQVLLGAICIQEGRLSDTIVYVVGDEIREGGVGGNGWVGGPLWWQWWPQGGGGSVHVHCES